MEGRVLVDIARPGSENMAIDQRMLEMAAETGRLLVRVYGWCEPTLSLGYFQKYADRGLHTESSGIAVVRRATGGGAIVHHHDWTYAIAVPPALAGATKGPATKGPATGPAQGLYDCIHGEVVQWLQEIGYAARMWSNADNAQHCRAEAGCSFLCFERRSRGDIVVGDSKVLGSAQRRHQGAVLQHGSLLLQRSEYAPSLSGLKEIAPFSTNFAQEFGAALAQRIGCSVGVLLQGELAEVHGLEELGVVDFAGIAHFGDHNWLNRR